MAGGQGKGALYVKGAFVTNVPEAEIVDRLMDQVRAWKG